MKSLKLLFGTALSLVVGTSALGQSTFETYTPGNGMFGLFETEQGFVGAGNHHISGDTYNSLVFWRLSPTGSVEQTETFLPTVPNTNWWFKSAAKAPGDGLYVLYGTSQNSGGSSSNWNGLIRFDNVGGIVWNIQLTSFSDWSQENLKQVIATPDGGCLVVGATPYATTIPKAVKVGADGAVEWTATSFPYHDLGYNRFNGACVATNGDYYAVGRTHFNLGEDQKVLVSKISASGEEVWSRQFYSGNTGVGPDSAFGDAYTVAPLPNGGCVVGGEIRKMLNGNYVYLSFLMALTADGDQLWLREDLLNTYHPGITQALALANGTVLVVGNTAMGNTGNDPQLIGVDNSGNVLWREEGYYRYFGWDLQLSSEMTNGNLLFCGVTNPDPGASIAVMTTAGGVFKAPANWQPSDNSIDQPIELTLEWNSNDHVNHSFDIEIGQPDFNNIVQFVPNYQGQTLNISSLEPNSTYVWRVRVNDVFGNHGPWSSPYTFTTGNFVGLVEMAPNDWSVWPNPASTTLNMTLPEAVSGPLTLSITDVAGRVVQTYAGVATTRLRLDVAHLANGLYTVSLVDKNGLAQTVRMAVAH